MQAKPLTKALEIEQFRQEGPEFCREIARKAGAAPVDLPLLVERIRNLLLSDRVAFYLNVSASLVRGELRLAGESERPEFKRILSEVFRCLGYRRIHNSIAVLPDAATNPAPFGVVTASHLLTYPNPALGGVAMDEAMLGEPVYVLKELEGVCLIKTFSGYWGFAARSGIRRLGHADFIRLVNAPKVCLRADCEVDGLRIPAGAQLVMRRWAAGARCHATRPDGASIWLSKKLCIRNDRKKAIAQVLAQAKTYLKGPYLMGGKNRRTGIDCSGLVQMSYRAIGLNLPRDARQQYLGGHLILPCAAEALLPGDALFFMGDNGQVDHVALHVGRGRAIHSTRHQKALRIQDLDPASANHLRRYPGEFIGAKRFWW